MNRIRRAILVIRHVLAIWQVLDAPKNRCKGDWRETDVRELLRLAEIEYQELFTACWDHERGQGTAKRVEEEAADLSAFAAMIADVARLRRDN